MFNKALSLAAKAHDGQYRYSGIPYIVHPIRVALSLPTEDMKVVALLHDVLEDTTVVVDVLHGLFPKRIVQAVIAITRRKNETYFDYLERCIENELALCVKIADIHDNYPTATESSKKRYDKAIRIIENKIYNI